VARVSPDDFAEAILRSWANSDASKHGLTKIWGRSAEDARPRLAQILINAGMKEVEISHPGATSSEYLDELTRISLAEAKVRFRLS
jgi:hypothetical protein